MSHPGPQAVPDLISCPLVGVKVFVISNALINEDAGAGLPGSLSSGTSERHLVQCPHGGYKAESLTLRSLVGAPALGINRGFEMQHDGNQYDMLHCNKSILSTGFFSGRSRPPTLRTHRLQAGPIALRFVEVTLDIAAELLDLFIGQFPDDFGR